MDRQKESNKLNNYGVAAARPLINIVFSWSLEGCSQCTSLPKSGYKISCDIFYRDELHEIFHSFTC
ncbi:hypothetical protein EV2_044163 [Malus domestica]